MRNFKLLLFLFLVLFISSDYYNNTALREAFLFGTSKNLKLLKVYLKKYNLIHTIVISGYHFSIIYKFLNTLFSEFLALLGITFYFLILHKNVAIMRAYLSIVIPMVLVELTKIYNIYLLSKDFNTFKLLIKKYYSKLDFKVIYSKIDILLAIFLFLSLFYTDLIFSKGAIFSFLAVVIFMMIKDIFTANLVVTLFSMIIFKGYLNLKILAVNLIYGLIFPIIYFLGITLPTFTYDLLLKFFKLLG